LLSGLLEHAATPSVSTVDTRSAAQVTPTQSDPAGKVPDGNAPGRDVLPGCPSTYSNASRSTPNHTKAGKAHGPPCATAPTPRRTSPPTSASACGTCNSSRPPAGPDCSTTPPRPRTASPPSPPQPRRCRRRRSTAYPFSTPGSPRPRVGAYGPG